MNNQLSTQNTYSIATLLGNWQETRTRDEDTKAQFLEKCEKGQLTLQKMSRIQNLFLSNMNVTESTDEFLRWQNSVGLVCPPPSERLVKLNQSLDRPRVLLCADLDEHLIYDEMKLKEGTTVVGTVILKPMARSVFKIVSPCGCPPDCKVQYGVACQFVLGSDAVSDKPLYMASDAINTAGGSTRKSGNRKVFLHSDPRAYNTQWKLDYFDPRICMEMIGQPVHVNVPVIIRHLKTNSALAVEPMTNNGFFGRDYEVSTSDHLDSHRAASSWNYFCLTTNLEVCEKLPEECEVLASDEH